jgi:hypothetical protein
MDSHRRCLRILHAIDPTQMLAETARMTTELFAR